HSVYIVLVLIRLARIPFEEIDYFDLEIEAPTSHHDVVCVQVAMRFLQLVNRGYSAAKRVKQVQRFEGSEPSARLLFEQIREHLSVSKLGKQEGNRLVLIEDLLLRDVLNNDGAMPQLVQLAGIELESPVVRIAMRKKELCRPVDAGHDLPNTKDFTFPTTTQLRS